MHDNQVCQKHTQKVREDKAISVRGIADQSEQTVRGISIKSDERSVSEQGSYMILCSSVRAANCAAGPRRKHVLQLQGQQAVGASEWILSSLRLCLSHSRSACVFPALLYRSAQVSMPGKLPAILTVASSLSTRGCLSVSFCLRVSLRTLPAQSKPRMCSKARK